MIRFFRSLWESDYAYEVKPDRGGLLRVFVEGSDRFENGTQADRVVGVRRPVQGHDRIAARVGGGRAGQGVQAVAGSRGYLQWLADAIETSSS